MTQSIYSKKCPLCGEKVFALYSHLHYRHKTSVTELRAKGIVKNERID